MVASTPGASFFGTRLMVGFGGFSTEPPLFLLVLKAFWTWGLSLSLTEVLAQWVYLSSHLLPLVVLGIISSSMTLFRHIYLCCWYFGTLWVDTTYDLGVLSPGVGISVAGCNRLTFGAFCIHTGCWSREWW